MQSQITDRTTLAGHHGDCYLVTGSIGPEFSPRCFDKKRNAESYAKDICRAGRAVFPPYQPCIEFRYQSDYSIRGVVEKTYSKD